MGTAAGRLMELVRAVTAWFVDPGHWTGADAISTRVLEHLLLSGTALAIAALVALPIGLWIGHTGRGATIAINVANIGRAMPSYALLLVLFPIFHFGTPLPALVLLAIPPILVNAYTGIRGVDREIVEAGRGMGFSEVGLLRTVELPAGLPIVLAGLRTASVQVIATATLAALVAGGGLGRYIVDGFALREDDRLVAGAVLVALLAVATERAFTLLGRRAISPGLAVADG